MQREPATLTPRGGEPVPAEAEVVRLTETQRLMKALPVGVGGVVVGLATIPVPGLHFVAPWLVPFVSVGAAVWLYNRKADVGRVTGTCGKCQAAVDAVGGPWEDPMHVRCPSCSTPLILALETPL